MSKITEITREKETEKKEAAHLRLVPKQELFEFRDKLNDHPQIIKTYKSNNSNIINSNLDLNFEAEINSNSTIVSPITPEVRKRILFQPAYIFSYSKEYYDLAYFHISRKGVKKLFPGAMLETSFFVNNINAINLITRYKVNSNQYGIDFEVNQILKNDIPIVPHAFKIEFFIKNFILAESAIKQNYVPASIKQACDKQTIALLHLTRHCYMTFEEYKDSFKYSKKLEKI